MTEKDREVIVTYMTSGNPEVLTRRFAIGDEKFSYELNYKFRIQDDFAFLKVFFGTTTYYLRMDLFVSIELKL